MKLRIKENTLRLRLTRTEVDRLATGEMVENITRFGAAAFRFAIATAESESVLSVRLDRSTMLFTVPTEAVSRWAAGHEVGLYAEQQSAPGETLSLVVEKDFRCLDPRRDEDESDHFDNPLAEYGHHSGGNSH